jgi:hypothetical protein
MEIKIYQINSDRDVDGYKFMGMDWVKKHWGEQGVDSEIYDKVYEGTINGSTLEDVFCTFNFERPVGFKGHSLSVSDIVEVIQSTDTEPGFYFCDSIGFQKVDFDTSRVPEKEETIRVVLLEPGKLAKVADIDSSLEGLQKTVDGWIEAVYPFEEEVCIVCNEEGKINRMPLNRAIRCEGQITDVIAGPCFICSCDKASFGSLSEEQQKKYLEMFKYPEHIMKVNNQIVAFTYNPQKNKEAR